MHGIPEHEDEPPREARLQRQVFVRSFPNIAGLDWAAQKMKNHNELGELIEAFVNRVSHPRGRTLNLMAEASVTMPQSVLLNFALNIPSSTPSSLASIMRISLPSISQMIERLVKLGLAQRIEDPGDRRRKTVKVTHKAKTFLTRLKAVRSAEYAASTADLSPPTRQILTDALLQAMKELNEPIGIASPRRFT